MDRRYSQARFYSGVPASSSSKERSEALVRRSLAAARQVNRSAQSYGGSTGGASSFGSGGAVAAGRGADLQKIRESFQTYGSGDLGARQLGGRASLAEIRGFRSGTGTDSTGVDTPAFDQP